MDSHGNKGGRVKSSSISDFLFDEARSQELYVNRRVIHTKILHGLLREYCIECSQLPLA